MQDDLPHRLDDGVMLRHIILFVVMVGRDIVFDCAQAKKFIGQHVHAVHHGDTGQRRGDY